MISLLLLGSSGFAQTGSVAVSRGGHARFSIVTPGHPGPTERFAAEELAQYLREITGIAFAVYEGPREGKLPLWVGTRNALRAAGVALLAPARGYDGYALHIAQNEIVIAGNNPRGTLYGAYALLERAGCRWFYPRIDPKDREVIPRERELTLDSYDGAVASPFRFRILMSGPTCPADATLAWAAKARYNAVGTDFLVEPDRPRREAGPFSMLDRPAELPARLTSSYALARRREVTRRGLLVWGPSHGFDQFLPNNPYFRQHPEWFGMRDGKRVPHNNFWGAQFCWSNDQAVEAFASNVAAFLKRHPVIDLLGLYPLDNGRVCECENCRKYTPTDLLLRVMNRLQGKVHAVAPHVVLDMLGGYYPAIAPPQKVKPASGLAVTWAHWGRGYMGSYEDPGYGRRANLEGWMASGMPLGVYQYYGDTWASPCVAAPYALAIAGDYRYLAARKAQTIALLWWPADTTWWNSGLNAYLAGVCAYDRSVDPLDAVDDYARCYYGTAGPAMAEYCGYLARDLSFIYRVTRTAYATDATDTMEAERKTLAHFRQVLLPIQARSDLAPVVAHRLSKSLRLFHLLESLQAGRDTYTKLREAAQTGSKASKEDLAQDYREAIAAARATADYVDELIKADDGLLAPSTGRSVELREQADKWQNELDLLGAGG